MPYDILAGIAIGLSVLFFWLGTRAKPAVDPVEDQVSLYLGMDGGVTAHTALGSDLARFSFVDRVAIPMWTNLLTWLGSLSPQKNVEVLTRRLETAGRPYRLTAINFLGLQLLSGPLFCVIGFVVLRLLTHRPLWMVLIGTVVFGLVGFYFPHLWLSSAISQRKRKIVTVLPDALDMIVVCVEAGQSFDQALKRVSARWQNPLTDEFNRILTEIALGRTRREALSAASDRIQLPDMSGLIAAILQADQLGVSIAQVLRTQADQMRMIRRQRAEGLAREASIKLLFPLVFLIFPAMFAVLLGPAIPILFETVSRF